MSQQANPDLDPTLTSATEGEYKYGFTTDIDTDILPPGLTEDTVRFISRSKGEPEWLLEFRLKAFRYWLTLTPPTWAHLDIPPIDFQAISYWAAPKKRQAQRASTRSTHSLSTPSTASAYHSKSRRCSQAWPSMP